MAASTVSQLLFLASDNPDAPIKIYINSPGGVVTSGMAIYDCMQLIPSPIETWCLGQAASMGSLLLTAGTPGQRYALPNSRIMIHQPSGGAQGQATDIMIQVTSFCLDNNLIHFLGWRNYKNEEKFDKYLCHSQC